MPPTDPLVRWETAAIREAAARRPGAVADESDPPSSSGDGPASSGRSRSRDAWITLRAAHYETGLPVETIRKWARRKHIPSELVETEFGTRRVVDLVAVQERAQRLGRELRSIPTALRDPEAATPAVVDLRDDEGPALDAPEAAGPGVTAPPAPVAETEPADQDDADEPETTTTTAAGLQLAPAEPAGASATIDEERDPTRGAPPGTMIVPIAAWDRMLMQLGNLHQAGQQLADARERAAKAETEATFLRERLAELRARTERSEPSGPAAAPAPEAGTPQPMWRYVVRGWRSRRG